VPLFYCLGNSDLLAATRSKLKTALAFSDIYCEGEILSGVNKGGESLSLRHYKEKAP
jgi:CTP-dependent riboflavin kinase